LALECHDESETIFFWSNTVNESRPTTLVIFRLFCIHNYKIKLFHNLRWLPNDCVLDLKTLRTILVISGVTSKVA
jgi:hypothetical protein